jgi:hypothetical protein
VTLWVFGIATTHCFNFWLPLLCAADNVDLGTACGKYFRVSVLAITDPGDSDIIKTTGSE